MTEHEPLRLVRAILLAAAIPFWTAWPQAQGVYQLRTPVSDNGGFMLTVCAPSDVGRTLQLSLARPQGGTKVLNPWLVDWANTPCTSWQLQEPLESKLVRLNTMVWLPLVQNHDTRQWLPVMTKESRL